MTIELKHHRIATPGVELHVVTAGSGPALVLLHGWPQTWFEWRTLLPELAKTHTVIAPDLRGLGDSGRPLPPLGYDKQSIAEDVRVLARKLGHTRVALVGHDWGGIVAYHWAASYPEEVSRLAVLDVMLPIDLKGMPLILPGVHPAWHFAFHMTPEVPELLLEGRVDAYLHWWFERGAAQPGAVPAEAVREYVRAYSAPGAMVAGLEYYRSVREDIARVETLVQKKLTIPVLAIGGARTFGALVERSFLQAAEKVEGRVIADCGHWMTEEKPHELLEALTKFLS